MKKQIFKSFAEDRYAYLKEAYDPDRDPHGRGPDAFKVSEKPRVGQQVVTNDGVSGTIDEIRGEDIIVVDQDGGEHIVSSEQISIEVAEDYNPDQHSYFSGASDRQTAHLLTKAKTLIANALDNHGQPLFYINGDQVDVIGLLDDAIAGVSEEN